MYDTLTPDKQSISKRIYNTGTSTAFVRIDLLEVNIDKSGKVKEAPVKEIAGNSLQKDRLIVTPLRMIIPPGDRSVEKYYRVRFVPVLPKTDDGFGLNNKEVDEYRKKALNAGLNVLSGYGTLVIVLPTKPVFNTQIESSSPAGIKVTNKGTATIVLENIRNCTSSGTGCNSATRLFILPGKTKVVDKQKGRSTLFTLIEGENQKKLRF
ncbi:hypothetical protein [Kosakonia sacchari]|uniref:hypothetical protein n=1 Tax=Kosakonia sacchari TaxID=1158459 RepID=UPI000BE5CC6D|nr:hypothetical protein [Kosakonia sacchari]PDO88507.1 hypothetical protein BK797_03465 [Kosakonia sacchari]